MDRSEYINSIKLSKTFLFVDDDEAACISARRIANIYGVDVQTANTAHSALVMIQSNPEKFFLILTDQFMPGMNGDVLLDKVKNRWPHIRRAMISGDATSDSITKAYETGEIFRYLIKPANDSNIKQLIEDACKHFLSVGGNRENIIQIRRSLIGNSLKEAFKDSQYFELFRTFDHDMLLYCQQIWQVCEISRLPLIEVEKDSFKRELAEAVKSTLVKMRSLLESSEDANHGFTISAMMKQFNIRGLRSVDRYLRFNEALFAAFISKFMAYYEFMGLDPKTMIEVTDKSIHIEIGDRNFYNDIFNPVLSAVDSGIDIVILQLESLMLLIAMKLFAKPEVINGDIRITLAI